MKTVNLERYSDPDVLREFSPRMLVALLDEDRAFLASKGVELPTVEEIHAANGEASLDYEALAPVFTAMADIPKGLVDRFHMVKAMSGPRQMDLILATVRERQLQFPLPVDHCSPEDIAAHLLLTHRPLFQELHAQAAVTRYGLRLLPDLYAHLNPMPFEAATQMEMDLAEDLRRAGYTVSGGH
jgi:hypothetical protein